MKGNKIFSLIRVLMLIPGLLAAGAGPYAQAGKIAVQNKGKEKNLVQNGGFEAARRKDLPDFWIKHTYSEKRVGVYFSLDKAHPYSGTYSAVIENKEANDSKWIQFVKVKPGTVYRLSCKIKAEGIGKDAVGANISVLGTHAFSQDLKDTGGEWVEVVLYGRTGPEQREFAAAARLGGRGSLNTGKACFDEFRVEEVVSPPPGVTVARLQKEPQPEPKKPLDRSKLIGSIILLLILLYTLFWAVYFSITRRKTGEEKWPEKTGERPGKISFSRKDYILCGALTLVYAIIAFINLGSLKAPQTFWMPAERDESFYIDLGEVKKIGRLYYFFGPGKGAYKIEFSEDLKNWGKWKIIEQATGYEKLEWRFITLEAKARYIKITVRRPGVKINEIGVFEPDSQVPLPIVSINRESSAGTIFQNGLPFPGDDKIKQKPLRQPGSPSSALSKPANTPSFSRGEPENVFDEQDTIAYYPDFMTGMYFDEVYHARTAYEHLHGIEPTETTHPPLGKVFISIGIAIFGMNPFGWRFMGTLLGILMVPLMYTFGLRVFKKTRYAFIAAFLMTFDFMHFVQTRIATIDVYGLFFIILMYYFMFKYFTKNFYRDGLKKTLLPLFFSGLFFGFGAACKWIVLYGGVGLAIIFFTSLYLRFLEYRRAKQILTGIKQKFFRGLRGPHMRGGAFSRFAAGDLPGFDIKQKFCGGPGGGFLKEPPGRRRQEESKKIVRLFPCCATVTLAWCLLFFIIIPLIIYGISYIPFMMVPGPGHGISDVISCQVHMYDYHSKIKDTHPFSSYWWEWPIMKTPVWYYGGDHNIPAGKMSTIAALGNPAVWWTGIIAVLAAVFLVMKNRHSRMFVVLVAFAAQYLTWAVAPRDCTFIYHFFGAVPFMIICITYIIKYIEERIPKSKYIVYGYLLLVLVLFMMFYPILSGMVVSKAYVSSFLRWFKSWYFFI